MSRFSIQVASAARRQDAVERGADGRGRSFHTVNNHQLTQVAVVYGSGSEYESRKLLLVSRSSMVPSLLLTFDMSVYVQFVTRLVS